MSEWQFYLFAGSPFIFLGLLSATLIGMAMYYRIKLVPAPIEQSAIVNSFIKYMLIGAAFRLFIFYCVPNVEKVLHFLQGL